MNNECKTKFISILAISILALSLGVSIYLIRRDSKTEPEPSQTCTNIDKYLNTNQSLSIPYPIFHFWHLRSWIAEDVLYVGVQCPTSVFTTNYEIVLNNTNLIATTESYDSLGYYRIIKDCHNVPIVKTERFSLGKYLPGPLSQYTIWFELSDPNGNDIYGYLVTEGVFDVNWRIVDAQGKILVLNERSTITKHNITIVDRSNPAGDPIVAAMMYALSNNQKRDYCNKTYFVLVFVSSILMLVLLIYLGWGLLKFVFKKKSNEEEVRLSEKTEAELN